MGRIIARHHRTFKRILFFLGLLFMAFGSVFMIEVASLGIEPWDVLYLGLHNNSFLSIGLWSIIIDIFLLSLALIITREKLKIGTILDALLVGVFIDFILFIDLVHAPQSLFGMISLSLIGALFIGFGSAAVIVSDLGAGPIDTLMLAIHAKFTLSMKATTFLLELSVATIGFLLGGPIGIVTFIYCLFDGLIIEYSMRLLKKLISNISENKEASLQPIKEKIS